MLKVKLKDNKGQSLMEVLVAIGVFVVGVATIGFLVLDANIASRQGVERTQATLLAREGLEAVRSIRDADFDNLNVGTHGIALSGNMWIFSGMSDTQDQFTRTVTITDIDVDTKQVQSLVTWQFTEARQNSVALTGYLTDWNQTHGNAGELNINISDAELVAGNRRLVEITIENTGAIGVTIDKITVWWDNSNLIEEIRIDGDKVWSKQGQGSPSGKQPSGTEIDIENFTVEAGGGEYDIDKFTFDGPMNGATFIILFTMIDGSTEYVLVEPEAGSAGQADSLVVDTTTTAIDGSDNTKVIGITIENFGVSDIVIDQMTISWTEGPGGNKIEEITINGGSVWAGNKNSGSSLDITDFTLVSGAGSYSIHSLDFKKSMIGTTLSITFTMSNATTKTVSNIQP